jgi:TRAP-type mannitol/chloroaromatic compound transport system permease small subunit
MTKASGYSNGPLMTLFSTLERLSVTMAFVSGIAFILLSIFIAADVLGRGAGKFYTGATDEISGYVMAMAVTWALAYTLTIDKHVRVDLLLGIVSRPTRRVLDLVALLLLTVFAGLLSFNSWSMSFDSFEINALSPSILQAPLAIPQGVMALGFTMLAVQGLVALLVATFDPRSFEQTRITESSGAPEQFDI